jgi:putative transposase
MVFSRNKDRGMARLGRYFVDGQALHVIQRGNNRQAIFFAPEDYALYLGWLAEAARKYRLAVHAYVLMTNHVHLLVTPQDADSLPRTMQSLGRRYVRHVNARYRRTGTLWEGRYRAAPIDAEDYFLACCRYIEQNPVRAGMAAHARDYPWSSYGAHAHGAANALLSPHPEFKRLGRSAGERQEEYRALFRRKLEEDFVEAIRRATNGGWALGKGRFAREIARAAKRRAAPLPKGRPPAGRNDKRQLNLL